VTRSPSAAMSFEGSKLASTLGTRPQRALLSALRMRTQGLAAAKAVRRAAPTSVHQGRRRREERDGARGGCARFVLIVVIPPSQVVAVNSPTVSTGGPGRQDGALVRRRNGDTCAA
jgi:hypothetical protein